ncbi:transketolase C-terminal domain-containing protein [Methylophilaceae bacterium]|jgi:acetoin:2,6-dichlorophenolindophenol oxidoreductase subunit beta|nr:alpha-ketoacid dehydrogenase subunit beta [Methylophilaceae bacterium]MDC1172940.1 transketolase C-terminal domain-containing protein [Methylophilaceae bacterium]
MSQMTYAEAINVALHEAMQLDSSVICYGLGVTDPKAVFGTTINLEKKFGPERVFDMPTSENAMTGVAIGAALNGIKSVMTHQRIDFFLLAMDQLVNGAAKWHYMFGSQNSVPITIRLIIGRGWGQGPTHSQNLQAWFSHIPGLKVVMPTTPEDAKGMLLSSIFDPNPVIFLEHRWLHSSIGEVPDGDIRVPLGKAKIVKSGKDITLVAMSYMSIEAIHAADYLEKQGISCEVIDLRTIKPLDWETLMESVSKTGHLLALDSGFSTGSVAGEIIARVSMEKFNALKLAPARLAMPDVPEPTSPALTKGFYVRAADVAEKVMDMLGKDTGQVRKDLTEPRPHDIPGKWFTGPF